MQTFGASMLSPSDKISGWHRAARRQRAIPNRETSSEGLVLSGSIVGNDDTRIHEIWIDMASLENLDGDAETSSRSEASLPSESE